MPEPVEYAILNADGVCINRCLWDGVAEWRPPDGCTAVADPEHLYAIVVVDDAV